MAKQINLTVNVDDQQFRQFTQSFTNLSSKIQGLNTSFQSLGRQISQSNKQANDLMSTLKNVLSPLKEIESAGNRMTRTFTKWTALVGSIAMMLGTGAGLFGIERLTNTLVQRRKEMAGLGATSAAEWGRTQTFTTAASATLDNPAAMLKNIRRGQLGDPELQKDLLMTGIPGLLKDTPAEAAAKIIERIPDIMKGARKGFEEPWAKAHGLTALGLSMEDVMRLAREPDEARRIARKTREAPPGLSEEESKKWAELYTAAKDFVMQIQTKLGQALAGIAGSLTDVSKGFTELVKSLLDMPVVQDALKQVKEWLDKFAEYLKSDDLKKKLAEWSAELEKIDWKGLGQVIGEFVGQLGQAISFLIEANRAGNWLNRKNEQVQGAGKWLHDRTIGPLWDWMTRQNPDLNKFPINPLMPTDPRTGLPPLTGGGGDGGGGVRGGTIPPPTNQQQGAVGNPLIKGWNSFANQFSNIFSGGMKNMFGAGPPTTSQKLSFNDSANRAIIAPNTQNRLAFAGNNNATLATSTTNMASWSGAAQKASPDKTGGGWSALLANYNQTNRFNDNRNIGSKGPLDTNNWQSTRTASIKINNVSGSNLNVTANGMA